MMQTSFWDIPAQREAAFLAYHDESGTDDEHDRFLLQGVLFVPEDRSPEALRHLMDARAEYPGRIHFVDLRDHSGRENRKVAWNWIKTYFTSLSSFCPYKCMIVDKRSRHPKILRYSKPYELYNYSAKVAFRGALAWSMQQYGRLRLTIFSEKMYRCAEDNFATYLPREIARANRLTDKRSKLPPIIEMPGAVRLVGGDPRKVPAEDAVHCEFIQLTDLLTGAVAQAVKAGSTQSAKLDMATLVANWISDTRLPSWLQTLDLSRRFSVSCFPDANGNFYDVPLSIERKDQIQLFENK